MLDWINDAWRWSRTVFVNALSALGMIGGDLIAVLLGYDWGTVIGSKWAGVMVLGLNVVNVLLRLDTNGPVGSKS